MADFEVLGPSQDVPGAYDVIFPSGQIAMVPAAQAQAMIPKVKDPALAAAIPRSGAVPTGSAQPGGLAGVIRGALSGGAGPVELARRARIGVIDDAQRRKQMEEAAAAYKPRDPSLPNTADVRGTGRGILPPSKPAPRTGGPARPAGQWWVEGADKPDASAPAPDASIQTEPVTAPVEQPWRAGPAVTDRSPIRIGGGAVVMPPGYGPPNVSTQQTVADPKFLERQRKALEEQNKQDVEAMQDAVTYGREAARVEQGEVARRAAYVDELKKLDVERRERVDEARKRYDADLAAVRESRIDPARFWADAGTGGKVMAGIGMLLSGIGVGLAGGENLAMKMIDRAIDRDIDAQKANLAKRQWTAGESKGYLGMIRENYADDAEALSAVRAATYEWAQQRLRAIGAQAKTQELAHKVESADAELEMRKIASEEKYATAVENRSYTYQGAQLLTGGGGGGGGGARKPKQAAGDNPNMVPGFGVVTNNEARSKLIVASRMYAITTSAAARMRALLRERDSLPATAIGKRIEINARLGVEANRLKDNLTTEAKDEGTLRHLSTMGPDFTSVPAQAGRALGLKVQEAKLDQLLHTIRGEVVGAAKAGGVVPANRKVVFDPETGQARVETSLTGDQPDAPADDSDIKKEPPAKLPPGVGVKTGRRR